LLRIVRRRGMKSAPPPSVIGIDYWACGETNGTER